MRLIPLTSSSVAAIGWKAYLSPDYIGTLGVVFQNGTCYVYGEVPIGVFVSVITDPESQGHAFSELVRKGNFPFEKVDMERLEAV